MATRKPSRLRLQMPSREQKGQSGPAQKSRRERAAELGIKLPDPLKP